MNLSVFIDGIGVLAPGLESWSAAAEVLAGRAAYAPAPTVLPAPAVLPPAERRRASRLVKTALGAGLEAVNHAGADASSLATVFASSSGDGHNCHAICETLASDDRSVSPTRFHNSVHNAAAGYWGIATGAMAPSQVLCAFDAGFAAGLLEAAVQVASAQTPVLLVVYDAEYPEPIFSKRPVPDAGAIALLLSPARGPRSLAAAKVSLGDTPMARMDDAAQEKLRSDIPAMRGLPLLQLIARGQAGGASLEYLAPLTLQVDVAPC
ncbi:MAG: beta-ketoacyl synthase chain length factor [Gammaproteobacteria bacterium]|nr:beta-ketoacyl synthase chain length factor [Gammaproteobacteria bacterium]MBU1416306.1 beta-ketoacyl synthase chain length factor [Gammaproteobacteria bacterium]